MGKRPKTDQWVWVLVQNPGGNEQIVGQKDEQSGISFIPTFLEKEDAQRCYHFLSRERGSRMNSRRSFSRTWPGMQPRGDLWCLS